jgi:hypothetical protein
MHISRTIGAAAIIAAGSIAFAVPALADECTDNMAVVEQAVASAQLSEQDNASVQALIEDARAKQAAGDTEGCATTLAEAKTILQVE